MFQKIDRFKMTDTLHTFTYKELAEILVKHQNIHDGFWGLYIKFGISAANIGPTPKDILPAAIIPVVELGIQEFKEENNLSVDASIINPLIDK